MKYAVIALVIIFQSVSAFAQSATARFQGRLKPGSAPNSVIVAIRSNETFTGNVSNFQFTIQTPIAFPEVVAAIKHNPFATYLPTSGYSTENSLEFGYKNFLFGGTAVGSPNYTFTNGVEVDVLEIAFLNGPTAPIYPVRLAQLPGGGATTQKNFYIEINGIDNTNQTAMFYGSSFTNDPLGYAAYSFSALTNVSLPIRWLAFNVSRQGNDGLVEWDVEGDNDNEKYIVERSFDGSNFVPVVDVAKRAGTGSKKYSYLDNNITSLRSKIIYYRIKSVELNNRFTYTDIKNIRLDVKGGISLYPIPAKDGFTLSIPYLSPNQEKVQLHLVNSVGQVIERRDITRLAAVNYYYNLQSSLITSGEYLLKIFEDGQLTETKRVLIKK